jgi:hypothetical protein
MEGLLALLRQAVSLSGDEFKMLLHQTAGQLAFAEHSWAKSMRLDEEILSQVGLLLESEEFCQELASRWET